MTLQAMTWGDTTGTEGVDYWTLPYPDSGPGGIEEVEEFVGGWGRKATGKLRMSVIAQKWKISVTWSGLSAAELATLRAAYEALATTPAKLVLPDGTTHNEVLAAMSNFAKKHEYTNDGRTAGYRLTLVYFQV